MGNSWKFINGGFSLAMFDHRRVHTLYLGPIHKNWIRYGTVTFQAFELAAYWWVYTTFIGSQINGFCLDSCRIPIFVGGLSPFWLVESHPILVLHHVKAMARSRWWPTPWTTVPSRFQVCMCIYTHKYIYIYTHVITYTAHKAYWGSNSSVDDLGKSQTASHVWSSWVPEMIQWFLDQWKCWLTSSFDPSSPEIKCQSIEVFMFGSPLVRFQYLRISASTIHPIFPQWAPNFYDYWNTHGVNSMCWPQIT